MLVKIYEDNIHSKVHSITLHNKGFSGSE